MWSFTTVWEADRSYQRGDESGRPRPPQKRGLPRHVHYWQGMENDRNRVISWPEVGRSLRKRMSLSMLEEAIDRRNAFADLWRDLQWQLAD